MEVAPASSSASGPPQRMGITFAVNLIAETYPTPSWTASRKWGYAQVLADADDDEHRHRAVSRAIREWRKDIAFSPGELEEQVAWTRVREIPEATVRAIEYKPCPGFDCDPVDWHEFPGFRHCCKHNQSWRSPAPKDAA